MNPLETNENTLISQRIEDLRTVMETSRTRKYSLNADYLGSTEL